MILHSLIFEIKIPSSQIYLSDLYNKHLSSCKQIGTFPEIANTNLKMCIANLSILISLKEFSMYFINVDILCIFGHDLRKRVHEHEMYFNKEEILLFESTNCLLRAKGGLQNLHLVIEHLFTFGLNYLYCSIFYTLIALIMTYREMPIVVLCDCKNFAIFCDHLL